MSNITIDPCTRLILDFIRGGVEDNPSGEAKGNYNAYFGHVDSDHDFSKDTLADVYNWQTAMLRRDSRSTAVGGYQFLKKTLQSLQAKLNLPATALFTPALQEELAVELLKGRGYQDWWRGDLSDEDFLHNLSEEWASLPDPQNNGRSHYDGDAAGNHASTTQAKALAMLARARALISAEPTPAPQPAPLPATSTLPSEEAAALAAIGELQKLILMLPSMTVNEKGDANTLIRALRYIVLSNAAIRQNNL